jgi:hypothetical protein
MPVEYLAAGVGEYSAGQLVQVNAGELAGISAAMTAKPAYLCVADQKVDTKGALLPVERVSSGFIYETSLSAAVSALAVGTKLSVAKGGLQAVSGTTAGAFEVVSFDGADEGSVVRGRFV